MDGQNVVILVVIVLMLCLAGILIDIVILRKLVARAVKKRLETQRIFYSSIRFWIVAWSILLCGYFLLDIFQVDSSLLHIVGKVLSIAAILSVSFILANIGAKLLDLRLEKISGRLPGVSLISGTFRVIIIILGLLTALHRMGISIVPILTGLGVGGVAIALALQETLTNFIAGINILFSGVIRVGDYVKLDTGEEGFVEDISWRSTLIRELSNNLIVIPNTKISNAIVKNFSLPQEELSVIIPVTVSYNSDLERVERITIEVAKEVLNEVEGGVRNFEPFIRYHTFGDNGIIFSVILRVNHYTDQYLVKHEFIKRLHKRYDSEGIEIPFPQKVVHFGSGFKFFKNEKGEI
ncbi:MAG: mechanosensitive ion channel family protein [bacterium]|nr:mechanosensitive ion channel family protein [bacterium]